MSTIESVDVVSGLPALMTVEQLAKVLQVSIRSVWRMRSAGQVPPPVKIGGGVRWRVRDVQSWIDEGCPTRS